MLLCSRTAAAVRKAQTQEEDVAAAALGPCHGVWGVLGVVIWGDPVHPSGIDLEPPMGIKHWGIVFMGLTQAQD